MKIAPTSAATKRSGWKTCRYPASAVPDEHRSDGRGERPDARGGDPDPDAARPRASERAHARRGNFEKSGLRFSR